MLKITIQTNNGMIANNLAEHPVGQLLYSQGDYHQIELVILHHVERSAIPNILRALAEELDESERRNESFEEWKLAAWNETSTLN